MQGHRLDEFIPEKFDYTCSEKDCEEKAIEQKEGSNLILCEKHTQELNDICDSLF